MEKPNDLTMQVEERLRVKLIGIQPIRFLPDLFQLVLTALFIQHKSSSMTYFKRLDFMIQIDVIYSKPPIIQHLKMQCSFHILTK